MVPVTVAAAFIGTLTGVWWLALPISCVPAWVASRQALAKGRPGAMRTLLTRWGATVFVVILILSAFATQRVEDSVFLGPRTAEACSAWLSGAGGYPWGVWWMIALPLIVLGTTAVSGSWLGWVVMSMLLGDAAVIASGVFAHSYNILHATPIALAPWQLAFFAGVWFSFEPAAAVMATRFAPQSKLTFDLDRYRRPLTIAGALFAAAILLSVVLSGPYTSLVAKATL